MLLPSLALQHRSHGLHHADTLRLGAQHHFVVTLLPPTGSGLFIFFLRGCALACREPPARSLCRWRDAEQGWELLAQWAELLGAQSLQLCCLMLSWPWLKGTMQFSQGPAWPGMLTRGWIGAVCFCPNIGLWRQDFAAPKPPPAHTQGSGRGSLCPAGQICSRVLAGAGAAALEKTPPTYSSPMLWVMLRGSPPGRGCWCLQEPEVCKCE